jgi:hypothetical protein
LNAFVKGEWREYNKGLRYINRKMSKSKKGNSRDDDDDDMPDLVPLASSSRSVKNKEKKDFVDNSDDMSVDTNNSMPDLHEYSDDSDASSNSSYEEIDDDDSDDSGDESDKAGVEEEEDDEDDSELCQCPTCRREREKAHRKEMEVLREKEVQEKLRIARMKREQTPKGPGTKTLPFSRTQMEELSNGKKQYLMTICAMDGYKNKSHEELRFEDLFSQNESYMKVKNFLDNELSDRGREQVCVFYFYFLSFFLHL